MHVHYENKFYACTARNILIYHILIYLLLQVPLPMLSPRHFKSWLYEHAHHVTYIPDDLKPYVDDLPPDDKCCPWWLAEAIVKSAIDDKEAETLVLTLLQNVKESVQAESLMENVCEIVENIMDIMSFAFRTPALKNTFNKDNTFITVYYLIVFIMSCAISEDRDDCEILATVRGYEKIILRVSSMAGKLLLNNDAYEFIVDTGKTCMTRGRFLC